MTTNGAKKAQKPDYKVAVVGAGFSGLGMAIKLEKAGIDDFIVIEAGSDVGGTWRDSKYPGAAVDVPNHLYSYSFEQNKEWTRMFSKSEEIQQYILDVTEKYNLRRRIIFDTRIIEAKFDEEKGWWEAKTNTGKTVSAQFIVSAIGPFAKENIPPIPGLKDFKGEAVHTAKWREGIDLKGKKVAVVGSGASSIQVVPAIVDDVADMKVFMIEPSWIVPKVDYEYTDIERFLYRNFPIFQNIRRGVIYGLTEVLATGIVYDTPVTSFLESRCKKMINENIRDPELRRKLTPDYRLGKTRMLISNDYYPALDKDHVDVIDKPVEAVTKTGVIADGKEYDVDVIIWATGYKSPSEGFPFPYVGRDGQDLNKLWEKGGHAFKGVTIAGFPNTFALMGPNTGPGHTSVLVYVEAQQDYIAKAISHALENGFQTIEVKPEREVEFNQDLMEKMKKTTWGKGGDSWYYAKNGVNTTLYPGFAAEYVLSIRNFEEKDYLLEKEGRKPKVTSIKDAPKKKTAAS